MVESSGERLFTAHNPRFSSLLMNKIKDDRSKGIVSIVYTFLGNSRFGNLSYSISLIKSIKKAHPQSNIILHIPLEELNHLHRFFEILDLVLIHPDVFTSCSETLFYLESLGPDLVISQDWNLSAIRKTKPFPFVFINTHPYDRFLQLTNIHTRYMTCFSQNASGIIEMPADFSSTAMAEIKTLLAELRLQKLFSCESNKSIYQEHLVQFHKYRQTYRRIVLFSYSSLGYKVADGLGEMRRLLSSIPGDYLILFTIHPGFKNSEKFSSGIFVINENLDHELWAELHGKPTTIRPLSALKDEFPNLVLEDELVLFRAAQNSRASLTDLLVAHVDCVVCAGESKVCFVAMEENKPIFAYHHEEDMKILSYELLGLEMTDIKNYDFSYKVSFKYDKILNFMFTKMMHLPNLGIDKNPQKLVDFIEYENSKRFAHVHEDELSFYDRQWQSLEDVYVALKTVAA